MKIAFDVDGVVLKSIERILEHVNGVAGTNLTPEDLRCWQLDKLGVDLKVLRASVNDLYAQSRVEPYEGAVEVLSMIHQLTGEPLLFITGRRDPETARRQLEALEWNCDAPKMLVTGGARNKRVCLAENSVEFIVEDDPVHLAEYLDAGVGVGLMVRPWNEQLTLPVTRRFLSWRDVGDWFMSLPLEAGKQRQ
jgi:hypothetical protein